MKTEKKYSGVIVPMVTPFTIEGKIDFNSAEKIINNFIKHNVYPFIIGTTGEASSIPDRDKLLFTEFVSQKFSSSTKIYAGISSNCFHTSVENAKRYLDNGVTAVVAHLPTYYQLKPAHMLEYYEKLAHEINGPLIIYNITATTHMSIPLRVVERLSYNKNIVGLKDSERDLERLDGAIDMWKDREDFSHLVGWGAKSLYGLLKGSDGIVPSTGNFIPGMYYDLYIAALNNDKELGEKLLLQTDAISAIYQRNRILSESLPVLKIMMAEIGLCERHVLPPFINTPYEELEKIIDQTRDIAAKYNLTLG